MNFRDPLAWIQYWPRYPRSIQEKAALEIGVPKGKLYEPGKDGVEHVGHLVEAVRKGSTVCVWELRCLAGSWPALKDVLDALEAKGAEVFEMSTERIISPGSAASLHRARSVYAGLARIPTRAEAKRRGEKGGKVSAKARRIKITEEEHGEIWRNAASNEEAVEAISEMLGRDVSEETIRRKLGKSGRTIGWKPKR